jgi:hypothetical protein
MVVREIGFHAVRKSLSYYVPVNVELHVSYGTFHDWNLFISFRQIRKWLSLNL